MKKSKLLATAFALTALSFTSAQAAHAPEGMEKCKAVDGTVKLMDYGRKKAIFLNFRQQEVFE